MALFIIDLSFLFVFFQPVAEKNIRLLFIAAAYKLIILMAGYIMPAACIQQFRLAHEAAFFGIIAAGRKSAARRRIDRGCDLTSKDDPLLAVMNADRRYCRQERLRIGMDGIAEEVFRLALLHYFS